MTHHRIERLLEDGRLEEVEPDPGADDMKELADAVEALFGLAHDYLCERLPDVEDELALP